MSQDINTLSNLDAALGYAARGYHVFPVHGIDSYSGRCTCGNSVCERAAKHPATPNGLLDATTDEAKIREFFTNPELNVGIRTGSISGGLVVLDIDPAKGGNDSIDKLFEEHGQPEQTFLVKTGGGGRHYYFNSTGAMRNRVEFRPGLDIRGEGGYVVAAPSTHSSGGLYAILVDSSVCQLPGWLKSIIGEVTQAPTRVRSNAEGTGDEPVVPQGGRNDYLARIAGTLRRRGLSQAAIEAALLIENDEKCDPPLSAWEVRGIAASIARYMPDAPVEVEKLNTTTHVVRVADLLTATFNSIRDKDSVRGLTTAIPELDDLLGGGYRLGELSVLCASAKTGKSSWYHYLIYQLLKRGIPVAYASREMRPAEEVIPNLLSIAFKENAWTEELTPEREAKYKAEVETWPLYFSRGYGYFPTDEIEAWVGELRTLGVEHFYVDHLHYLLADPEDYKEAVPLAQKFKELVLRENIHINLIVQPGKIADGFELGLNSLRGGAGIGQALDNLFILERHRGPDGRPMKNISRLKLEVARHKLARAGYIYLEYEPETTAFYVVEPTDVESQPEESNAKDFSKEEERVTNKFKNVLSGKRVF